MTRVLNPRRNRDEQPPTTMKPLPTLPLKARPVPAHRQKTMAPPVATPPRQAPPKVAAAEPTEAELCQPYSAVKLEKALHQNNIPVVRQLIAEQAGFSYVRTNSRGRYRDNLTEQAVNKRRNYCLQLFITAGANIGLDKEAPFSSTHTPLHAAAAVGNLVGMLLLLKAGADIHAVREHDDDTVVNNAVNRPHALYLALRFGGKPNPVSDCPFVPLFDATFRGHHDSMLLLLQANADPDHPKLLNSKRLDVEGLSDATFAKTLKTLLAFTHRPASYFTYLTTAATTHQRHMTLAIIQAYLDNPEACQQQWRGEADARLKVLIPEANKAIRQAQREAAQIYETVANEEAALKATPSPIPVAPATPVISTETQLVSAIDAAAEAPSASTDKAKVMQQMQTQSAALSAQQSQLAALATEINQLQQAGNGVQVNTAHLATLQQQHDVMAGKVGLLFAQYVREQARLQAIEALNGDPRLSMFYQLVQAKLENTLIGYKAAASGILQIQSSQIGSQVSSAGEAVTSDPASSFFKKVATKTAKLVGRNGDKILQAATQGIELLGVTLEFLPGVGAVLKGAGKALGAASEQRALNTAVAFSEQVSMTVFSQAAAGFALNLTQLFKVQLLSLPNPEDEKAGALNKLSQRALKSLPPSSVRRLAEHTVLRILDSLHAHNLPTNPLTAEGWVAHWLQIVQAPKLSPNGLAQQCLSKLNPSSLQVTTQHGARWDLRALFSQTGIQVAGVQPLYFAHSADAAERYGFREGSQAQAQQLSMRAIQAPGVSQRVAPPSENTQAKQERHELKSQVAQLQRQGVHARVNRGSIEQRLAGDLISIKLNYEAIFKGTPVTVHHHHDRLSLQFNRSNASLLNAFVDELSCLQYGMKESSIHTAQAQVTLQFMTPSMANRFADIFIQQGMTATMPQQSATPKSSY